MANSIFKVHEMINKVGFEFDDATAKKVAQLAEKAGQMAAQNMTKELSAIVSEMGNIFNQALTKIGKQPIDLTDMLKMPDSSTIANLTNSFVSQIVGNISGGIATGISGSITDAANQIQALEARKAELYQQNQKLDKRYSRFEHLSELSTMDYSEFKPLPAEDDLDAQAERIMGEFVQAEDALNELTRGTKEYNTALIKALEAADKLYRMAQTLNQNKGAIKDQTLLSDYSMLSLSDTTADVFDKADTDFTKFFNGFDKYYMQQVKSISAEIDNIDAQLSTLRSKNPEIVNESKAQSALKTLQEIEAAYQRLSYKTGQNKGQLKNPEQIASALNYVPGTESLAKLKNAYTKAEPERWEQQYAALVKFVREYEAYLNMLNTETDSHQRSKIKDRLSQYTELYEQLQPMAANAENMLQNILNMANKAPLVGMGGDNTGVSGGVVNEAEKEVQANQASAELEAKARTEAEAKAKADAESAALTEQEKLAQEAVAKAEREALENSRLNLSLKEQLISASKQQAAVLAGDNKAGLKESMRLVGSDGVLSTAQGQDLTVDAQTMVNQLAANLKNSIVMSLHDHPNAMDMFTPDDVNSFAKLYYGQGIKINGIIANGVIKTIDFSGISQEIAIKIGQSFSENLSKAAQQTGLFSYKDNNIIPAKEIQGWMSSDPEKYDTAINGIRDIVDASLNDAFRQNGVESTLQQFSASQLPELTQWLLSLQQSAQNAVAPVDKLKNLLMAIKPNQAFEWGNYTDIFSQFENGAISGIEAINQINTKIKQEAQAHQENTAAINAETQAQENLNKTENQNPPAQDDSGIHNANADAINNEASAQEELAAKIKKTQALIKNQQNWLRTLDPYLSDANYKTSGKKEATDQLRDATNSLIDYRRHPEEYDRFDEYSKQKKTVNWNRAYQEAQRQGVADSVLQRYDTDAKYDYEASLQALQKERDYRAQVLQEKQKELLVLQQQLDVQNQINAAKTQEPPTVDDSPKLQDENAKLDEQNGKLKENINLKGQANGQGVVAGSTGTAVTGTVTTTGKTTPTQTIPEGTISAEAMELEAVRQKVAEVTAAVNIKSKAFYDEAQVVGQAVGKENAALISLKGNIDAITSAVNTKTQAFLTEQSVVKRVAQSEASALNTVRAGATSVRTELGNINTMLGNINTRSVSIQAPNLSGITSQGNITNEAQALTNLQTRINEVTAAVQTKTTAFAQEEITVVQSIGNEINALTQLLQNINNVNTAISALSQGLNNVAAFNGINLNVNSTVNLATIEATLANILTAIPNAGNNVQNNNAGGGGQGGGGQGGGGNGAGNLAGRITVQASILDNFEAKLMDIGQLTPAAQNQIDQLRTALNNVADAPGLTAWMNQFRTMRTDMNTAGIISDLDTLGQMATRLGNLRAKSAQAASSEEKASWDALIQQQEAAMQHMQQGAGVDQDWLDNRALEAYTRSMEKYNEQMVKARANENRKEQQKTFNQAIKDAQREAGLSKSKSAESRAVDTLVSAGQIPGISPEQQTNLDTYRVKIEALKNTIANFPDSGVATEAQKNQLIAQRLEVDAYTKEIQELIANYERLSGENAKVLGTSTLGLGASADAYQQELTQTIMAQTKGRAQIKAYDAETRTLTYTLKTGKGEFTQYAASVRQADGALVSVLGTTTRAMGVFESIGKKIKEYSYYFTGSMMIYRVIAWVREGVTAVKEIDAALTELKKVTDETEESYDKFLNTAAKTAEKVGSTIKDVVSSTADWARLGYSMQEAHTLATSTQILMNVSEFDDISKATDTLISSIQAFKYTAEESMDVVDILNTIGNNYAISTADLAESLTKSSGSLVAANGTLEEAVALTATANTIIQDADVVGTALKTVAMRLRGTDTKTMEEEGLETDGMVESSSKLRGKIKGLSGVDILTDTGAYKSTYQILSEIAEVWETMNDMDQAALLELLAGKRAGSVMSAILQNPETLKDAFESASDATGSAMTENEKYLDSIQGRLDLFTNAVQTMWNDTLNSDFLKFIINAGTALIKLADGIDIAGAKIGSMWTTALALIVLITKRMTKLSWGGYFASIGTTIAGINTKLETLLIRLGILKTTSQATQVATQGLTVGMLQEQLAARGVSEANQKLILSKVGLDAANTSQAVSSEITALATLKEAVANKSLTEIQAFSIAQKLGLITATKGLNGATANRILMMANLDRHQRMLIIKELGLVGATKKLTVEEIKNALVKHGVTDATKAQTLANLLHAASLGKVGAAFKLLTMQMNEWIAKNKLLLSIAAVIGTILLMVKAWDAMITTLEESEEKLTELNSELESTEGKLEDLESQLKEVKDRIKELNEQESLTFIEQEEIDRLREQNAELERQIGLTKQVREAQQKEVNNQALKTADQYKNAVFKNGKGQSDYAQTGSTVGSWIGGAAGGIGAGIGVTALGAAATAGGGAIAGSKLLGTIGTFLGGPIGTIIGVALGAAIGAAIVGAVGSGVGAAIAEGQNQVGEAMDDMLAQRKKLEEKYNKAQAEYAKKPIKKSVAKEYEEAEEALANYDSMMSEHLTKLDSYYSQIDLSVYDPTLDKQKIEDLRKEMNDFYDTQDKWAIANGGQDAKNNAITRIFGTNASDELKRIKKEIQNAVTAEDWDGNLNLSDYFNAADLDAFTARLHEMGIYVFEVENYFKDMAQAEKEAAEVSLYGVATDINKITDGLENLKSAFDEVLESGSVTAKTLAELYNVFGVIDSISDQWDNYVNTMFSGVSSTREMQEATEALAKAFIDSKILTGEAITAFERMTYIIQLRNMGVENAEEYVDDKIAENAYKAMQNSAEYNKDELEANFGKLDDDKRKELGIDGKAFDELSTEELNKIAEYYNMSKEINAETAQQIADEYGVEIENLNEVIDLLEEKEQAEKKASDAKKVQDAYQEWVDDYKAAVEDVGSFNPDNWEVSAYGLGGASYYRPKGMTNQEADQQGANITAEQYEELKAKWDELQRLINSEEGKKWLNEDGILKEGVEAEFAAAYEAAQKGVEELENQIETELTADIKLKLELQEKNKVIDDIQSVFDSLKNAQKEYAESGYLSVDTMQELLGLEPKYLTLLYDENGQLNLNEEALYRVAEARITDMGIAQQNAIVEQALELATTGSRDALLEYTTATYGAVEATESLVESQLKLLKTALMNRTQDQTEEQTRTVRGRDGQSRIETVTVVTKVADLSEEEANQIYDNTEKAVNAVNIATQQTLAGVRKGGLSTSGQGGTDDALEALQKRYERQIKNLENQQTQIENQIEWLEAKEQGVSADYYEKQIDLEEDKIALYEQELTALKQLERTDEVVDAIWEVEHAIQESTISLIEFRKAIAELYATASDRITDAYDDLGQVYDDRKSYIENEISIRETKGELTPSSVYDELIEQEKQNRINAEAELNAQADLYWQGINNGELEADSEEAVAILEKIRQKKLEMQESDKAIAEYAEQQKDAYIEYFDKMMEAYSHRNDFFQMQSDYAQSYIDRLGTLDINVPDEAYEKMAEIQELNIDGLKEQLAFANSELENLLANGIDKNDPRYIEKFKETLELEKEIYDAETQVYEYHQQIFDNQIDRFNQVIDRIDDAIGTLQNVSGLLEREDVATEDGEWTAEGITRLGMAYQQMEYYKQSADEITKEMAEVTEAYNRGEISEKKYYETMQELENQKWDAINSYEDMKDTIIDLNEARIDMIEEGLNKEAEAYNELIDLKKEALDAERDLYSFRKDVQKQTKDIAALERRIAGMSGSTDASTIAERTKLEAQLREAKDELDDTYYNHAMDSQSNALDDELEAFTKSSEDYIKSLRESIKDTNALIEQTFIDVMQNGEIVLETLTDLSNTYGFQLDEYLTSPWENATDESLDFETYATQHFSAVYNAVNTKTSELTGYLKAPWEAGEGQAKTFSEQAQKYMGEEVVGWAEANYKDQLTATLEYPWDDSKGAYQSWGDGITSMLQSKISEAKEAGRQIAEALSVETSSYVGNSGGNGSGDTNNKDIVKGSSNWAYTYNEGVKTLQEILVNIFGIGLDKYGIDGQYGESGGETWEAVKAMQRVIGVAQTGKYDATTSRKLESYLKQMGQVAYSNDHPEAAKIYEKYWKKTPAAMFAKGTLGTSRDQLAITDESWIGEEITLAAGKNGQLQYLKKGSAVMPADISANLVEWGKLNPNMLGITNMTDGISLMSNYINKPEIKVDVENFLKVGTVSRDTLPELEKLMDKKIDTFAKQLNASIRKFK